MATARARQWIPVAITAATVLLIACARPGRAGLDVAVGGGVAGAAPAPGGAAGAAGSGGDTPSPSSRCDRCAAERSDCLALFQECQSDADCSRLLDCVYSGRGCALDAGGGACVTRCVSAACASPAGVALFVEADRCAYCTSACRTSCDPYCATVDHERLGCAGGSAGSAGSTGSAGANGGGATAGSGPPGTAGSGGGAGAGSAVASAAQGGVGS